MAIPAEERLHLDVERAKTSPVITEVRVRSLVLTNTAWADGQKELDIVIAVLRLTLGTKRPDRKPTRWPWFPYAPQPAVSVPASQMRTPRSGATSPHWRRSTFPMRQQALGLAGAGQVYLPIPSHKLLIPAPPRSGRWLTPSRSAPGHPVGLVAVQGVFRCQRSVPAGIGTDATFGVCVQSLGGRRSTFPDDTQFGRIWCTPQK
jgi:hypothetical protein